MVRGVEVWSSTTLDVSVLEAVQHPLTFAGSAVGPAEVGGVDDVTLLVGSSTAARNVESVQSLSP